MTRNHNYHTGIQLSSGKICLFHANKDKTFEYSTDNGQTWTRGTNPPFDATYPQSVVLSDDTILTIGGENLGDTFGKVYKSTDAGESWTIAYSGSEFEDRFHTAAVDPIDDTIYVVGGEKSSKVYKSTDKGLSWSLVTSQILSYSNLKLGGLAVYNGTLVYAVARFDGSYKDSILISNDSGVNWTEVEIPYVSFGWMGHVFFDKSNNRVNVFGGNYNFLSRIGLNYTNQNQEYNLSLTIPDSITITGINTGKIIPNNNSTELTNSTSITINDLVFEDDTNNNTIKLITPSIELNNITVNNYYNFLTLESPNITMNNCNLNRQNSSNQKIELIT